MTTKEDTMTATILFTNGERRVVDDRLADRVVGIDADGDLLVPLMDDMPDYLVPLTPCCNASGKGMDYEYGVGCRKCKREVDPKYGGREDAVARVMTVTRRVTA